MPSKALKPINLQLGWPSPYLVPREALLSATQTIFSSPSLTEDASIYGPDPGQESVREHVAEWLTKHYTPTAGAVTADRVLISNGASANLGNILAKFTDPIVTRRIWMIEPTYFLACPVFEDAGFVGRLRGVPEDDEGLDIGFLQRELATYEQQQKQVLEKDQDGLKPFKQPPNHPKLYRHIIYCVPSYSNPSAKTMSLRRREELVQLARQYDALIISDDVYDILRWPAPVPGSAFSPASLEQALGPLPPRLVDIDRQLPSSVDRPFGNTCSNGSFSKVLSPGARTSYAEGTPSFIHTLSTVGSTRSGGAPSQMASIVIDQLLISGALDKHIQEKLIPTYAERSHAMYQAITEHLVPLGVQLMIGKPYTSIAPTSSSSDPITYAPQSGGFFTYILLPSHLPPASVIAKLARKTHALKFAYGTMMTVQGDPESESRVDPRGVRLSWSWHSTSTLVRGIKRLAAVLKAVEKVQNESGGPVTLETILPVDEKEEDDLDEGEESGVETYFYSN